MSELKSKTDTYMEGKVGILHRKIKKIGDMEIVTDQSNQ